MPDTTTDEAETVETDTEATTTTETTKPDEAKPDEWEQKYQGQLKVNRDLEAKLAAERKAKTALELQNAPAEEQAAAKARAEATAEITAKANSRILKSELRAHATGKLADPTDAALFLDLDKFAVTDDGDVDSDALDAAIADLITRKPHLAAPKANTNPFQGGGDGGAKSPSKPDATLAERADVALAAGDVRTSIALKTAQLKPLA